MAMHWLIGLLASVASLQLCNGCETNNICPFAFFTCDGRTVRCNIEVSFDMVIWEEFTFLGSQDPSCTVTPSQTTGEGFIDLQTALGQCNFNLVGGGEFGPRKANTTVRAFGIDPESEQEVVMTLIFQGCCLDTNGQFLEETYLATILQDAPNPADESFIECKCMNGGTCKREETLTPPGVDCVCPPGFAGPRCEHTLSQFNAPCENPFTSPSGVPYSCSPGPNQRQCPRGYRCTDSRPTGEFGWCCEDSVWPCPFESAEDSSDCCHFRRKGSSGNDVGCMGGSVWSDEFCACVQPLMNRDCDASTCDIPQYVRPQDCSPSDNQALRAEDKCCNYGDIYTADDTEEAAYSLRGGRLLCHPGQVFSLDKCACVGTPIMENAPYTCRCGSNKPYDCPAGPPICDCPNLDCEFP